MKILITGASGDLGKAAAHRLGNLGMILGLQYRSDDNVVRKLVDVGTADMQYGECEVQIFNDVKVDGRLCKCVQVVHPRRRSVFLFHIVRIFITKDVPIPVRYEAYDWPIGNSQEPPLIEEYTFQDIRLNVGFSDAEFQRNYQEYKFRSN